jgi:hypothetical protein
MALEKVTSACHEAQAYGTEQSQAKAGYQDMGVHEAAIMRMAMRM